MMRMPQAQVRRSQIGRTAITPAPIGGWNARDALAAMAPEDAVILQNFWPTTSGVELRNGSTTWATGLGNQVNSLMGYNPASGALKLFAAAGGAVFDVTAGGAVGAPALSGLTNDKWIHTNFATPAGPFLAMVNGADGYYIYNGTTWLSIGSAAGQAITSITNAGTTATLTTGAAHGLTTGTSVTVSGATPAAYNGTFTITVTGANTFTYVMSSTPTGSATVVGVYTVATNISGVDPKTFSFVTSFANRLWFIQANTLNAYYLPVQSFGGAAQLFPLQAVFQRGGSLIAMGVWTVDGGYGMQDNLCFVSSEGEIAIYQGTDPSQASTFQKVGTYQVGTPMGNRCFMKYGGDLLYIGKDGLGPISQLLASSRINTQMNLTYKIQGAVSAATTTFASNFGWQMMLYPLQNALILNVPMGFGQQQQYLMNTITGAWCNFTGWTANCWERLNDQLYFGSNGTVVKAWTGNFDDNGAQINGESLQAFQNFGTNQQKQFTLARPLLQCSGVPGVLIGLNVDFDTNSPVGLPSFSQPVYSQWDQGKWDQAIWGSNSVLVKDWEYASGVGTWAAMHIKASTLDSSLLWAATSYLMNDCGVL